MTCGKCVNAIETKVKLLLSIGVANFYFANKHKSYRVAKTVFFRKSDPVLILGDRIPNQTHLDPYNPDGNRNTKL